MARIEDLLQLKNRDIEGVRHAPILEKYPETLLDGPFTAALSWVTESRIDSSRTIRSHTFECHFYLAPRGEGTFARSKALYPDLRDAILDAYEVRSVPDPDEESHEGVVDIAWQSSNPNVRIVPGSVFLTGSNATVSDPAGNSYHGMVLRGQIDEKTNRS